MNKRLLPVAFVVAAGLAIFSGCASSTESTQSERAAAGAVTIENCGRELTFAEAPSRVVLLNGASVAEVNSFIALGIEDSVIANMQAYGDSDDPTLVEQIAALPDGGLALNENFGPPAEQVLALEPDLVVSTYAGGFDSDLGFASRDELASVGANAFVTPANCGNGNPDATDEERDRWNTAGIDGSYELLRTLGEIFQVEEKAEEVIADMQSRFNAVSTAIEGTDTVSGVILSPGFTEGAPAAWTGGIFDDVLTHAGVENVFAGQPNEAAGTFSAEQLLAVDPQVVVLFGMGMPADFAALRANIEQQFPDWSAVKSRSFVIVYDGVYLGPTNAPAVENIARVAHPDAF